MREVNIPKFSYYDQHGNLITKDAYTTYVEDGPYMRNLIDEYSEGLLSNEERNSDQNSNLEG